MIVKIGKGLEIEVDTTKFNNEVLAHVTYIGLKNILQDTHANVSESTVPKNVNGHQLNNVEYAAEIKRQSLAAAQKKLDAMYAGEIRAMSERSRLAPIEREARIMCITAIQDELREKGKKLSVFSSDQYAVLVQQNVHKFMDAATEIVAKRAEKRVEVDLGALGL